MTEPSRSRRALLRRLGLGLTTVSAGCSASPGTPTSTRTESHTPGPATDPPPSTATETPTEASDEPARDPDPDVPPGKLVPADGDANDNFGSAVAVTADRALVAAVRDEHPNGTWAGSAYVFGRGDDGWTQAAKLVPDDGGTYDRFGSDVALSGDTALVGAPDDGDPNGEQAGSAYVFERGDDGWVQRTKLLPDDGDSWDHFGSAVALSGDRAVVGAAVDEHPSGGAPKHGAGSAYVFERGDDGWVQRTKLAAVDGDANDLFGDVVAQSTSGPGATVLVGAPGDEHPNGRGSGAAYVFERADGTWDEGVKLAPDDGDADDGFGGAVALVGDLAVVGAEYDEDPNGNDAGAAYVFAAVDGEWIQRAKLAAAAGTVGAQFGRSVALAGDAVLVGSGAGEDFDAAHEGRTTGASGVGVVHTYRPRDGSFERHETLTAVDGDPDDNFGSAVAAHGTTALVGAVGDEDPHGDAAGAAYVVDLSA